MSVVNPKYDAALARNKLKMFQHLSVKLSAHAAYFQP